KSLVGRGELGRLWYVYSNRVNLGKVRSEENILWSFAPHDVSVITGLVGAEPRCVSAFGANYLQDGVAGLTMTDLRLGGEARAAAATHRRGERAARTESARGQPVVAGARRPAGGAGRGGRRGDGVIDHFVHASSYVDEGAEIGAATKIWHFCHVMPGARIG